MIKVDVGRKIVKVEFNNPKPVVKFDLPEGNPKPSVEFKESSVRSELNGQYVELFFKLDSEGRATAVKRLGVFEHVLGLGEKALPVDRRRTRVIFWNYDNYNYKFGTDPLYKSIPFAIFVEGGKAIGIFVNSATYTIFDLGVGEYDKALFQVYEPSMELYIIFGPTPLEVIESYTDLTGKPLLPPRWGLGLHISRYSYYPQDMVIEIVKETLKHVPVDAVYLDIDYMEGFKQFTWDRSRFPNPKEMIDELHRLGVKVVVIVDPYIKLEPGYPVFESGIKHLCRTPDNEIYVGYGWPGLSGFPDFFNGDARRWWADWIERFAREYGIDGIWIDMNEPSTVNLKDPEFRKRSMMKHLENLISRDNVSIPSFYKDMENLSDNTPDLEMIHRLDDGRFEKHYRVRNAYPLFEAMATYEGLKRIHERPFILSRSAYAGSQKYAFIWTGDVPSDWEALRLSISMILGVSASGHPWIGVDVGGFAGWSDPEATARWYQAMAFAPFYRVHKGRLGNDTELFRLPARFRRMAIEAVKLRYRFLPYLWHLAWEAHLTGRPLIRALPLEFPEDENTFSIDDQYMVGPYILYAPILDRGAESRFIYLPHGSWFDYWSGEIYSGRSTIRSASDPPIFIRESSAIPVEEGLMIFREGSWRIYHGEQGEQAEIVFEGNKITQRGSPLKVDKVILLGIDASGASVDGAEARTSCSRNRCEIVVKGVFREIKIRR